MNTNVNWATLIPTLLGAAKLILEPFGIIIPDQNVNEIANGIAALATVIGIIISHRKQTAVVTEAKKPEIADYH